MPSSDSRYRFVVRNLDYPYSETAVWEIRDTLERETVFTSNAYDSKEACEKDLKMLLRSHVIRVSTQENDIWLD